MARTAEGAALTEQHRRAQLQLRAQALRAYAAIWPLWTGDETSFQRLLDAAVPLVRTFHTLSASLAGGYFENFRAAERVGGSAAPVLAGALAETQIRGTLHVTGADMARRAILAGQSPQAAMQTAFVRTSGTSSRLVLNGGRDTVLLSSAEDGRARGWRRVTSGKACAFCAMLASRGAAYLSESTAEFQAHDHCSCAAEALYDGSEPPPSTVKWSRLWDESQRAALEAGEPLGTRESAFNAFRRHLSRQ